jgi:hypothetical protein
MKMSVGETPMLPAAAFDCLLGIGIDFAIAAAIGFYRSNVRWRLRFRCPALPVFLPFSEQKLNSATPP